MGKWNDKNGAKSRGSERGRIVIRNILLFVYKHLTEVVVLVHCSHQYYKQRMCTDRNTVHGVAAYIQRCPKM